MKHHLLEKALFCSIILSSLISTVYADNLPVTTPPLVSASKFYVGVFTGGGSSNDITVRQFGTVFFSEAVGGPLAVNASTRTNVNTGWLGGAQVGYQHESLFDLGSQWSLGSAIELEAYGFGNDTVRGNLINNTDRLAENEFAVSYTLNRSVFLTNAVLSFDNPCILFHPYVGFGFGGAVLRITNAISTQIDPVEDDINHYNSNNRDTVATFAGQAKIGLRYDFNDYVSVFAEYRWLYLANSHFILGPTIYPSHAPTTDWQVKFDALRYNLGTAGIRVNF